MLLPGLLVVSCPCDAKLLISDEVDEFLLSFDKLFTLSELLKNGKRFTASVTFSIHPSLCRDQAKA
jgi:hypothetical protein